MSALRPPGLGPLIGHTTDKSCRLWIKAQDPEDRAGKLAENRRTVGVIGVLSADKKKVEKAYYFRLQREFDRTGTFVVGEDVALGRHKSDPIPAEQRDAPLQLTADTNYIARMATLSIDDPMPNDESLSDVDLVKRLPRIEDIQDMLLDLEEEACEAAFRTFPDSAKSQPTLAFLLGSCRYPGLLWKIKEADRIFAPMQDHLIGQNAARFTLMVGDQIYADKLHRLVPIGLADTYEEFQERYATAFSSVNMRLLLRTAPNYMILDDHEIEDNWTQDRLHNNGSHQTFNLAIGAYMSYQWSHGPRTYGRLLYYNFVCAGYPFFVLDARTQRFKDDELGLDDNHLLGRPTIDPAHPGQLKRFLDWLSEQQATRGNVPKFVGIASVFVPNAMDERVFDNVAPNNIYKTNKDRREKSDSWPAYPNTRKAILEHIIANAIQNVVFLSGDIHCSNIAKLQIDTGADAQSRNPINLFIYDITSSAFYWPFPFADGDPNNYVHDSTASDQRDPFPLGNIQMPNNGPLLKNVEVNYKSWAFTQEDNFCRIDVDKAGRSLTVQYFNRDGKPIKVTDEKGGWTIADTLPLAAW